MQRKMISVLQGQNFTSVVEFVTALNKARLANKQKWITYVGVVAEKHVELKTFDTGDLQILRVNGIDHGGGMDLKVNVWKQQIERAIAG